ncbi:ImcF-related family protein [Sphingomonas sp. MMS24-JH45]
MVSARTAIQTLNLTDRAYAVLKQKAGGEPWEAADVLSAGDAQAFADPDKIADARVPFFFTRAGYDRAEMLGLAKVQEDLRRDLWVLGTDPKQSGLKLEMGNVRPGVAARYAQDDRGVGRVPRAIEAGRVFRRSAGARRLHEDAVAVEAPAPRGHQEHHLFGGARNMASRSGDRLMKQQLMKQRSLREVRHQPARPRLRQQGAGRGRPDLRPFRGRPRLCRAGECRGAG